MAPTAEASVSESRQAEKVLDALKTAEREPAQIALSMLRGLPALVQGEMPQPLEVEEARADAFLAVCEVGKALHQGKPATRLWTLAIDATERWMALAK
jgi:hypothetical protein